MNKKIISLCLITLTSSAAAIADTNYRDGGNPYPRIPTFAQPDLETPLAYKTPTHYFDAKNCEFKINELMTEISRYDNGYYREQTVLQFRVDDDNLLRSLVRFVAPNGAATAYKVMDAGVFVAFKNNHTSLDSREFLFANNNGSATPGEFMVMIRTQIKDSVTGKQQSREIQSFAPFVDIQIAKTGNQVTRFWLKPWKKAGVNTAEQRNFTMDLIKQDLAEKNLRPFTDHAGNPLSAFTGPVTPASRSAAESRTNYFNPMAPVFDCSEQ